MRPGRANGHVPQQSGSARWAGIERGNSCGWLWADRSLYNDACSPKLEDQVSPFGDTMVKRPAALVCRLVSPFDCAQTGVAEPGVIDTSGPHGLVSIAEVGIVSLPMGCDVFKRDGMAADQAYRQRGVAPDDVLEPAGLRRGYAADIVFAAGELEARARSEDQLHRKQRLRRRAVVIVTLALAVNGSCGAVAYPRKRGVLQRDRVGEPPLRRGAEGQRGAG